MDIIKERQDKRQRIIQKIKNVLKEIRKEKRPWDEKAFIMEICSGHACSERTAKEYLKVAKYELNWKIKNEIQHP